MHQLTFFDEHDQLIQTPFGPVPAREVTVWICRVCGEWFYSAMRGDTGWCLTEKQYNAALKAGAKVKV